MLNTQLKGFWNIYKDFPALGTPLSLGEGPGVRALLLPATDLLFTFTCVALLYRYISIPQKEIETFFGALIRAIRLFQSMKSAVGFETF